MKPTADKSFIALELPSPHSEPLNRIMTDIGGEGKVSFPPAYRKSCRKTPHPNGPSGVTILAGT